MGEEYQQKVPKQALQDFKIQFNKYLFTNECFFEFVGDIDEFARNYFEFVLDFCFVLQKLIFFAGGYRELISIGD